MDYGEILQDFPCNTFISIFRSPCVVICGGEGRRQGMLQVSKQAKTLAVEKFLCFFFFSLPFFLKEVLAFLQTQGAQMER